MLNRLLILWVVISTVAYGAAWAFDGHIDETAEHQGIPGDRDHATGENGDRLSCDHCCDASAHLMALWPAQTDTIYPEPGASNTPYRTALSFLATAPPERPPQG